MIRLSIWVLCCFTILLSLLFVTNSLDPKRQQHNYSTIKIEPGSYVNCEVALSLIVKQENSLRSALTPNTHGFFEKDQPCDLLSGIYKDNTIDLVADNTLRLRYIWGGRAAQGIITSVLSVNHAQSLIALLTIITIIIIGAMVYQRDRHSFVFLAPFLVGGALFSNIIDTSPLALSISYLWAWLAAIILIWAMEAKRDKEFSTIAGMISAYLWFMEGHFVLLIALIALISYLLSSQENNNHYDAFKRAFRNVVFTHIGFVLLTIIFIVIKLLVFGLDATLASYSTAVTDRLSLLDNDGQTINLLSVTHKLVFIGFQLSSTYGNVLLWKTILVSSAIVLFASIMYSIFTKNSIKQAKYYFILLGLISLYLALRLFIVPNHSYIHATLMSRYLFISIASIWSATAYLYVHKTLNSSRNK